MTDASIQALSILRQPGFFQWNVLFGLGLVLIVYMNEIQHKNWDAILLGLLFSTGEIIWEMINSLILHFTGYAGLWTTPGNTSFLILSGINIEIFLLFALAGVGLAKLLQAFEDEPDVRVLGLPYKVFVPFCLGAFCVVVECCLNRLGVLVWVYKYWNWPHVWSIVINYMAPFFLLTWVHVSFSRKSKQQWLAALLLASVLLWVLFVNILGWI